MWDPFLMKKLIKNEICGSINSAYDSLQKVNYCSLNNNRNTPKRVKTKNKKKKRNKTQLENADLKSKHTLNLKYILRFKRAFILQQTIYINYQRE